MPANAISLGIALLLSLFLLVSVTSLLRPARQEHEHGGGGDDPEVKICKQQCARQLQFGEAERRQCAERCDEYGRMKREQAERREDPERELERCLHECRAGPRKPGCERKCREAYGTAAGGSAAKA